jgi:hypothetical protein
MCGLGEYHTHSYPLQLSNAGWCKAGSKAPQCVWDDAGTAGKRGSFWFVNSFHTLFVVEGHAPPQVCETASLVC